GICARLRDVPGTCNTCVTPRLPNGAPCVSTSTVPVPWCRNGFCSPLTSRCTSYPGLGESCAVGTTFVGCAGTSFCNVDSGRCERLRTLGSTCSQFNPAQEPCEDYDALCLGDSAPSTCQRMRHLGEACGPGNGC